MFLEIEPKILYFGTPVVLISSLNPDGTTNIAPMSSAWALGWTMMLGLGTGGKTYENLCNHPECVLNIVPQHLWEAIERLAPLTGKNPVPPYKQHYSQYEPDKFSSAGLTRMESVCVTPQRVTECSLQLEAVVNQIIPIGENSDIAAIEVKVLKVHAQENIVLNENHLDPQQWQPLIYNFRHYYGLGKWLGKSFRAET